MKTERPTAMICRHCEVDKEPINLVVYSKSRHEFQFMCGQDGHTIDDADPIHVDHVFEDDRSLIPLAYISTDFEAERGDKEGLWAIRFVSDEYLDTED